MSEAHQMRIPGRTNGREQGRKRRAATFGTTDRRIRKSTANASRWAPPHRNWQVPESEEKPSGLTDPEANPKAKRSRRKRNNASAIAHDLGPSQQSSGRNKGQKHQRRKKKTIGIESENRRGWKRLEDAVGRCGGRTARPEGNQRWE